MKRLSRYIINFFVGWLNQPVIRFGFILPLGKLFSKHADEEILEKNFQFVNHSQLAGDYLEFGVWKGRSFGRAYNIWKYNFARKQNLLGMRFCAFDSFAGLPELSVIDKQTGEFKKGDYACDQTTFKKTLLKNGIDFKRVEIIDGWYDQSLNLDAKKKHQLKKAAVIWVDCDLYASTVSVLNFITDLVQDGTVIIFDDWFAFRGHPDRGEQKAFQEWLERNPQIKAVEWQKTNWRSNSFILSKTK